MSWLSHAFLRIFLSLPHKLSYPPLLKSLFLLGNFMDSLVIFLSVFCWEFILVDYIWEFRLSRAGLLISFSMSTALRFCFGNHRKKYMQYHPDSFQIQFNSQYKHSKTSFMKLVKTGVHFMCLVRSIFQPSWVRSTIPQFSIPTVKKTIRFPSYTPAKETKGRDYRLRFTVSSNEIRKWTVKQD